MANSKKAIWFAEAERLFVVEQMTLGEIERRITVSARTLQEWKVEGEWERKREQHLKTKESLQSDLYTLVYKLVKKTLLDVEADIEVSDRRLNTILKLASLLPGMQALEAAVKNTEFEKKPDEQHDKEDELYGKLEALLGVNLRG